MYKFKDKNTQPKLKHVTVYQLLNAARYLLHVLRRGLTLVRNT